MAEEEEEGLNQLVPQELRYHIRALSGSNRLKRVLLGAKVVPEDWITQTCWWRELYGLSQNRFYLKF